MARCEWLHVCECIPVGFVELVGLSQGGIALF